MTEAILFMLGLGAVAGGVLSLASKIFYVYEDPRIAEVEYYLAGANCGGCGYAGCSAAAVAVVEGKAPPSVCIVAGPETAEQVGEVMGIEVGSAESLISYNKCTGGERATDRFIYSGVDSCLAMAMIYGGKRDCQVGCIGKGDCVNACLFSAIEMGPEGYPVVNEEKCVGCGACEKVCPKNVLSVKTQSDKIMTFNTVNGALAPCRQTCPAEIDIPRYIDQISKGDYEAAVNTIRERNPLLLACGRVCPHPCEDYCRRGIEDEPVSINQLKRFAADYEMNTGKRVPVKCAPSTGKNVAVVGGGPAGLSCAFFLRRLGHDVTIFEAMPKLGGMLRYGIPEYRLPKKVLDWEIEGILNLGISARTNMRLGRDFDVSTLVHTGYDAVFMAIGAWEDYSLRVEGEKLKGCYTGIDFLSRLASGEKFSVGKKAAVIGGGNSAIDCVRNLIRIGCEDVMIVYRRTRAEMPANEVEIDAAEHEGVNFVFLAAPVRVVGNENGEVTHLEYQKMELGEPDASGRRRPVPIEGSETLLEVDTLITAIGQRPDISFLQDEELIKDIQTTRWNTFDNDPATLRTNIPYIFTAGDSATGPDLVVSAIGGGRRAARSIHQYLMGDEVRAEDNILLGNHIDESLFEKVPGVVRKKRVEMPELPVEERIDSFVEVDKVLTEEEALYESSRCLNCCRLCYDPDAETAA